MINYNRLLILLSQTSHWNKPKRSKVDQENSSKQRKYDCQTIGRVFLLHDHVQILWLKARKQSKGRSCLKFFKNLSFRREKVEEWSVFYNIDLYDRSSWKFKLSKRFLMIYEIIRHFLCLSSLFRGIVLDSVLQAYCLM